MILGLYAASSNKQARIFVQFERSPAAMFPPQQKGRPKPSFQRALRIPERRLFSRSRRGRSAPGQGIGGTHAAREAGTSDRSDDQSE
jgi:hypothetical protein